LQRGEGRVKITAERYKSRDVEEVIAIVLARESRVRRRSVLKDRRGRIKGLNTDRISKGGPYTVCSWRPEARLDGSGRVKGSSRND